MMGERRLAAGGAGVERFFAGLSSLLRAKRELEMVLAPVRGAERFFIKANCSLLMSKENQKPPAISTRWTHEKGAARPFQTPKGLSKPKNASRFAKRIFWASPIYGFARVLRFSRTLRSARA